MTFRRAFIAAFGMVWPALAGPPLTTIQDVLYKADGSRFSGAAVIAWGSFEASDTSNISTHNLTVKIVNGSLTVQLVPNSATVPLSYYTVKYNSDGKVQFQESWVVPPSAQPLRVRDVRVAAAAAGEETASSPVQESDVVGLVADLGARPVKGAGYVPGRVAVVNPQGALEAVAGGPGDCVRVDGSSGPCGSAPPLFVDGETPAGLVDGANTTFTVNGAPNPAGSLAVWRNGLMMKPGVDYSADGGTLTFVPEAAPQPGDTLLASYRVAGTEAVVSQMYPAPQVLCSGTGAATNSTAATVVGQCTIPGGTLMAGDRVQVLFDFAHQGTASGYRIQAQWGGTTVLDRTAPASEPLLSGRADAAVYTGGAQVSAQSWGTTLAVGAALASAGDALDQALALTFLAQTDFAAGDTVTLRSFTVVKFP